MNSIKSLAASFGAVVLLAGCSFAEEALWPSLTGEDPVVPRARQAQAPRPAQTQRQVIPRRPAERQASPVLTPAAPPTLGRTQFQPLGVTQAAPTGTFVGQKVVQLRSELARLQSGITQHNGNLQQVRARTVQNAQRYHGTVAAVNARLQVGTTPGNPVLVNQWNQAQHELNQVGGDTAQLNSLANEVASDSTMAAYMLESTRAAYGLSGAIDEDHRQLAILEDEVNRTVVLIDRLLNELSEDIARQTNYLNTERRSLTALSLAVKNGELYGGSLANRAFGAQAPLASAMSAPTQSGALPGTARSPGGERSPLVVIRFDRPDVEYQQPLYNAISRALERRPTAMFDLVAVAPNRGTPARVALNSNTARRNAESVLRTLTDMGLPAGRVSLSAATSAEAQTNEIHIYVR
ncbi:MAG: hypothetical protein ACTSRY_02365 [Alphaproteobacteria bacterium]